MGLIIGGIILALIVALLIASIIADPIKKLDIAAQKIANGDMNVDTQSNSSDEIGNSIRSFQKIKDSIGIMIGSFEKMAAEQKTGDLEARCEVSGLTGAYRDVVNGVNDALDLITMPVIESIGLMNEYAMGDFSKQMRVLPGKQIILTEGLNNIRTNIMALINDANMLAGAAVEGKLSTRADATRHQGDFRKIVKA